jgi:hypothetical protein
VFREAYAEHPDYVPLARRADELWDRFGDEAGTVFFIVAECSISGRRTVI